MRRHRARLSQFAFVKRASKYNPSLRAQALASPPINLSEKRTKSFADALC
jgi:hypothetical protein